MALITDPDQLNQSTEITINTSAKTITLNVAGNLSNDGVTGQALYSFLKGRVEERFVVDSVSFSNGVYYTRTI